MRKLGLIALTGLLASGCAFFHPKAPVAKMAEKYTVITGVLAAPAELKNAQKRLIVYFNEEKDAPPEPREPIVRDGNGDIVTDMEGKVIPAPKPSKIVDKDVKMCVAENDSNKRVLINIREYLNDPKAQGKTLFIYGTLLADGQWKEYLSGVHCNIIAIGFYVPTTGNYTYILTGFGDGVWDNFSWTEFMKKLGSKALDKAI